MIRLGVLQVTDAVVYLPGASFTNYPCFLNLHPCLPQYVVPEGSAILVKVFLLHWVFLGSGWRILEV